MNKIFNGLENFSNIQPIEKGWSGDKKYCITAENNIKYLLRISPDSKYESRKLLFSLMKQLADLNIPMCKPIEFGTCSDGVYSLQSWVNGEDLENVLPALSEPQQYMLGMESGKILRKIHSLPAPETQEKWTSRFNRKTDMKIKEYLKCDIRFDGDSFMLDYIENNRHLLENRPQCFQHGDYHAGNMMMENGKITIIDFDRYDFGDPWEEFNRIVWSADLSPHFATGQLNGYFDQAPPLEFFKLLAFYASCNAVSSIPWSIPYGKSDVDIMIEQAENVLKWFDNMNSPIPSWYLSGYEVHDVYDENRNKTGRFHQRGKPMAKGEYHLIVQVWKRNKKGEWLINQRTPRYGNPELDGKWETTGGAVIAGEDSFIGALREAKEELGIDLNPDKGIQIYSGVRKWGGKQCSFIDAWLFEYDEPIESVMFDETEVCDAMWASTEKIKAMVETGEFLDYTYFDDMIEMVENRI